MDLLLATRNAHKTKEIQQILGPSFVVSDLSADPQIADTRETGKSYEENAMLKAVDVSRHLQGLIVADDSGLEVDALGGAPGIFSARYAGENATDKENIEKLLGELVRTRPEGTKKSARFRCVIALARQGELLGTFEGIVEGAIVGRPRGLHGFGYDPIFVPSGFEKTFGQLTPEVKNKISHRAKAVRALTVELATLERGD